MLGELIPEEWAGKYVLLEIGADEPLRVTARLDRVSGGGIAALVKIAVPNPESGGRWAAASYVTKFGTKCYSWHSIYSIRLLEPEEKPPLEEDGWPPEEDVAAR